MMFDLGTVAVAKKKSAPAERKTKTVKLDAILARKAKTVCEDSGVDVSDYLSDLVRQTVERDWARVMKKINAEADE